MRRKVLKPVRRVMSLNELFFCLKVAGGKSVAEIGHFLLNRLEILDVMFDLRATLVAVFPRDDSLRIRQRNFGIFDVDVLGMELLETCNGKHVVGLEIFQQGFRLLFKLFQAGFQG